MLNRLQKLLYGKARPLPKMARHIEYSAIASADDDVTAPDELIQLALRVVDSSRHISMKPVSARMAEAPFYPEVWPGEHYKLLAGLVQTLAPKTVVEIGTFTGLSALAILQTLAPDASLKTFDLIPWNQIPDTCFKAEDFEDGRLMQLIGDVGDLATMKKHEEMLTSAELLFVDGPKDGVFEQRFLNNFAQLNHTKRQVLVFDDIRVWNMLEIWRGIKQPKLDLTSFGHWSGTGIVIWEK